MWNAPSPVPGSCCHVKVKVFSRAGYGRSAQLSRFCACVGVSGSHYDSTAQEQSHPC